MKKNSDLRILIVDDEKLNIELAAAYLKEENYKLSFALNAKSAIECTFAKEIDLILLDINMPQTDGFEVCRMLKEDSKTKHIPVIFLTAQTDIEYISRAFEVGGVDYVSKPFVWAELKARVKTHLQNKIYFEDIKDKQSRLAQLSITDSSTKLYNSLYFDTQVQARLTKNKKFWIINIRLNNFEKINNFYGYDKANLILKHFSKIIEETFYANSVKARLYGVNFGIIVKDYDKKDIKALSNSLYENYFKNKELKKIVEYSIAAIKVEEYTTLANIYKKIQNKIGDSASSCSLIL